MTRLEEATEMREKAQRLAEDLDSYHERYRGEFAVWEGPIVSVAGGRAHRVAKLAGKVEEAARRTG